MIEKIVFDFDASQRQHHRYCFLPQSKPDENRHRMAADDAKTAAVSPITETDKPIYIRDVLYGYVTLSPLARRFVDTPDFQALRDIRQLGMASFVFPSANHTRFEHSLGVYELVGRLLKRLYDVQPDLFPTDAGKRKRFIDVVQIAGLLHDVGHAAESHAFDLLVAPTLGLPHHEERGTAMIRSMVERYSIPIEQAEIDLIVRLILGVEPSWIGSIVNDREAALDMDKLDYLNRDSYYLGFGRPIQDERLLLHARVRPIPDGSTKTRICFHRKVLLQLVDVFQTRARLFREVYRHRCVVGLDEICGDLMKLLSPILGQMLKNGNRPTDAVLSSLPQWLPFVDPTVLPKTDADAALALWNRLQRRQLYKVTRTTDPKRSDVQVTLALSALPDDPLAHIWFFDDNDAEPVRRVPISEASAMLSAGRGVCSETVYYSLDRNKLL